MRKGPCGQGPFQGGTPKALSLAYIRLYRHLLEHRAEENRSVSLLTVYMFHRGNNNINFLALGAKPFFIIRLNIAQWAGIGIGRPPWAPATALSPLPPLAWRPGVAGLVGRGAAQGKGIWCSGRIRAKFFKTSNNTGRDGSYHLCGALCS